MRTSAARPVLERLGWVDALRGLAVALMVLDHVLVQLDPASPLRSTVTRASLPLFMACAARVWAGRPSARRLAALAAAAVCEALVVEALGMPSPGILAVFLLVVATLTALPALPRRPGTTAGLGLAQALYLPVGWDGYEPGLVLAWWCLGRLAADELRPLGERLPAWAGAVGRRPLLFYVGHLVALLPLAVMR